jgi:thiol-disulfide isomerase/thioredoxin
MLKRTALVIGIAAITSSAFAQKHPATKVKDTTDRYYLRLADSKDEKDKALVLKAIDNYSAEGNSEYNIQLAGRLADKLNMSKMSDSLFHLAAKRYPKGDQARTFAYNAIIDFKGTAKQKKAMYYAWLKKFPEDQYDIVYDYARGEVAGSYVDEKNIKEVRLWIGKIEDQSFKAILLTADGKAYLEAGDTTDAQSLIYEGMDKAKSTLVNNPNPQAKNDYYHYEITYASLLYSEKRYKEALPYIRKAYDGLENKSAATRELYAFIMAYNGYGKESIDIISDIIKDGKGNTTDLDALKVAYIDEKGSSKGFDDFLAGLKLEMINAIHKRLANEMMSQDAPNFTLVDAAGKEVTLADYKDKVVILDFWASWCAPCKRSFPAMQMAVDKYKSDPNVVFLFIDTFETIKDPKSVVDAYINQNKFSFRVLFDNKITGVSDKFGIHSIPSKFIIGPGNKIRFHLTGFDSSNEAAVEELSYMIEAAKKTI